MAAFGPIAERAIHVGSDAPQSRAHGQIEYVTVNRPIRPLNENKPPGLIF
jgi:hypothetical protein